MKRGEVVVVSAQGDFGKPRPAIVVQSDLFNDTHASITVCLVTSQILDAPLFRQTIEPTPGNGLKQRSQIMADKLVTIRRERVGTAIGRIEHAELAQLNRLLATWLGLGV